MACASVAVTQFTFTKRVGRKYFVSDKKPGRFDDAVKVCSTVGGVPALPKSQEENQALVGLLADKEHAWLSANDRITEGRFVDLQGNALGFTNWAKDQPNDQNGEQDCAICEFSRIWNDVNCDASFLIVCEI